MALPWTSLSISIDCKKKVIVTLWDKVITDLLINCLLLHVKAHLVYYLSGSFIVCILRLSRSRVLE